MQAAFHPFPKLNFPALGITYRKEAGQYLILDALRKKWLVCTPEEWVRQHMLQALIQLHAYPKALIGVEKGLQFNGLAKRTDILVRDREGAPFLLIECKAPEVTLSQATLKQLCTYNAVLHAPFLGITNGYKHLFLSFDRERGEVKQMQHVPQFSSTES
ncbi:MAG: type I restriction enzyme HsdR N-terminal domain-containing protein [Nitritalea sp.]